MLENVKKIYEYNSNMKRRIIMNCEHVITMTPVNTKKKPIMRMATLVITLGLIMDDSNCHSIVL